jgi:hypothetical protein
MKFLDPDIESAVRVFLARLPVDLRLAYAILYGARARRGQAELAYDVFLERGILVQAVPISLRHWLNPEHYPRPGFLRNVARDGIVL